MKILALSGWGQSHDALAEAFPDATHMHYAHHDSVEEVLNAIGEAGRDHDMIVGWSLGGQLAVRAIAAGKVMPKKLVLIAAPFQFVKMEGNNLGMKADTFRLFFDNYVQNPLRTLQKAWELIAYEDKHAASVKESMAGFSKQTVLANDWLKWLGLLEGFSCDVLDFSGFPDTLLVHGTEDAVVYVEQSEHFARRIPNARLSLWQGCGHAPHWHDSNRLRQLVQEHLHV